MRDTINGIAVLAIFALVVAGSVALSRHRRPPEAVVTRGSVPADAKQTDVKSGRLDVAGPRPTGD